MNDKRERSVKKPPQANARKTSQRSSDTTGSQPPCGARPAAGTNGAPQRSGAARGNVRGAKKKGGLPSEKGPASKAPQKRRTPRSPSPSPSSAASTTARVPRTGTASGRPSGAAAPQRKAGAAKRHKYRGGNYILYYMLAGVVIITVLAILANTVLFRCKQIVVSGNARYSAEEIAAVSGIALNNNLLHINTHSAEESIVAGLSYIDSATVKKSFPTGISISVVEAEKWFCVEDGGVTAAVSRGGKIVEHCPADGIPVFKGYEPESMEVGARLSSVTEGKNDIPSVILRAIETAKLADVDEVDITDRFSMKMSIDGGRVILELATVADMESKLLVANTLITTEIGPSENVTILLSNPLQPTVRGNEAKPAPPSSDTSEPRDPASDDSGDTSVNGG